MTTKLEQLKARLDKEQAKIAEMTKAIEDEELAELQAEEFAVQMADRQERIAVAVKDILDEKPAVVLPAGKSFTIVANEDGTLSVSTLAKPPTKERKATGKSGNGGRTTVTIPVGTADRLGKPELAPFEGKQVAWTTIGDAVGAPYGAGSAHRYLYVNDKELHDAIPMPHDGTTTGCAYI